MGSPTCLPCPALPTPQGCQSLPCTANPTTTPTRPPYPPVPRQLEGTAHVLDSMLL